MDVRCEAAVDAIQDVMRGAGTPMALAARLPAAVQDHLQGCPECREAAHELLGLDRVLSTLADEVPVPAALLGGIMDAVRVAPVAVESPRPPWGLVAAALALFCGALALVDVGTLSVEWPLELDVASVTGWLEGLRVGLLAMAEPLGSPVLSVVGAIVVLAAALVSSWFLAGRPGGGLAAGSGS